MRRLAQLARFASLAGFARFASPRPLENHPLAKDDTRATPAPCLLARVVHRCRSTMHCPSINVFGTFFPSWMLCALAGMVFAVVAHQVLAAVGLHPEVKLAVPVYGSLALAAAFLFWLVGYGS